MTTKEFTIHFVRILEPTEQAQPHSRMQWSIESNFTKIMGPWGIEFQVLFECHPSYGIGDM
jgi:hypothetical protein